MRLQAKTIKYTLLAVLLLILFLFGVGVRREILRTQYDLLGESPPFTLESALHYRLIEQVYHGAGISEVDVDIQYPMGVELRETYTVGAEYVYAILAKCCPPSMELSERIRWIELLWFCMGIPLMFFWLRWDTGSRISGFIAAAFYAVAISSVIRSTGQEISRENFALPLLIGHLAFDSFARHAATKRRFHLGLILSSIFLSFAAVSWDLIQYYVFLWAVGGGIRVARKDTHERQRSVNVWLGQWVLLFICCIANPYMRAHGWIMSIPMILSYCVLIMFFYEGKRELRLSLRSGIILFALILLGGWLYSRSLYSTDYAHFGELLWAKLRYLNRKPVDPSLLTFNQRIMWVPALHSTTWPLLKMMFPALFSLTIMGGIVLFICQLRRFQTDIFQHIVFYSASLIAFWLFFRFHVFLAIFSSALLGVLYGIVRRKHLILRGGLILIIAVAWAVETRHTLTDPARWGRLNVYYNELEELVQWLAEDGKQRPVLANFGVSASILTYGKCPVILHPKFESPEIRERVEKYGKALFSGTEEQFRDWGDGYGAEYYVYSLGEFSRQSPELQMRYFVNELDPPESVPARMFENRPEEGRYFRYLWGNRKYRVFDIITQDDESMAERAAVQARDELQHGDLVNAEYYAIQALDRDCRNQAALDVMKHVGALHEQDFDYDQQ